MTHAEFSHLLKQRMELMQAVLDIKAGEYASNGDRLHNFKAAADMLGTTPEKALLGMLAKHLVSVIDMVNGLQRGNPSGHPRAVWAEKIGDSVNYLCLLEGLVEERDGRWRELEVV
jgi:hypothetical protein